MVVCLRGSEYERRKQIFAVGQMEKKVFGFHGAARLSSVCIPGSVTWSSSFSAAS